VKKTAYNGRFCKSGAVTRPKGSENFQVLCLVANAVKPRLRKAAETLAAIAGQCVPQRNRQKNEKPADEKL